MAKAKGGLPEDFDIGVTGDDLRGPVSLPGYLDDAPLLPPPRIQKHGPEPVRAEQSRAASAQPPQAAPTNQDAVEEQQMYYKAPPGPTPSGPPALRPQTPPPEIRRRLQINLDPDSERMVNELLDLLSGQSAEHRIKVSELFQALLVNLYHARGGIVLGSLPPRGRWGSVTARSFPLALAESVRAAIVAYDRAIGSNPFKKVVDG